MTISTKQKNDLNKMNRASKAVGLGTLLQTMASGSPVTAGTTVVSSAQASASSVTIQTGLSTITAFQVQAFRSGSFMPGINIVSSGSNLTVTSASASYKVTENDVITWMIL
jgi:hypothetical protein